MAWFQWRTCDNMIPNVQHQLYQLYNCHWTQPYHEYQTSHVISNPIVVGGFYWFYSPLFRMANHPWEILETPREAASSLEGNLAAGLWSFGECSSESRGEQGSWGLVGWYGFTMIYPQFLWQLYALFMHFWWGNWQLAVNLRLPLGFYGILGFLIFPIVRRTWKPYVQNSSSSFSSMWSTSMWSTTRNQSSPIRDHLCTYTLYLHHHIISIMNHHILGDGLLWIPDSRKCWEADLGPCGFIFYQALRFFA